MLEVTDLKAGYGSGEVLHGVSFSVSTGILAVVGANAAGKSTTLKVLSGIVKPTAGSVVVDGRVLTGRSPADLVRAGVVHIPEGRQVFAHLSVRDNLLLGAYTRSNRLKGLADGLDQVIALFPELRPRLGAFAGSLSGGQQQMLAIGRGLMSRPRYLLLDEPSLGLAPQVTARIFTVIEELGRQDIGVVLVEQNGRLALAAADQALLLENGRVTLQGTGEELLANQDVIDRYLGVGSQVGSGDGHRVLVERLRAAMR